MSTNRYWLFVGDCYYACGGMHDFCGAYETLELATQHSFYEWWHVWAILSAVPRKNNLKNIC